MVADVAGACVIGVDVGGTKLLAATVGPGFEVHDRVLRSSRVGGARELLEAVAELVQDVSAAAPGPVTAVGLGVACLFDGPLAVTGPNVPLADLEVAAVMQRRLGLPVFADNDANTAALAEARHGAGRHASVMAMLTVGTGIGGGLVLDGELFRGAVGAAAEFGHMVVDLDGPPCQGTCPNRGCLEAVASGTALIREALAVAGVRGDSALGQAVAEGVEPNATVVAGLAEAGDAAAAEVLERIGQRLGVGVSNLVNGLNPDVVVIGGGVGEACGERLLGPVRQTVAERALPPSRDVVEIRGASLGAAAGALGAAALALDGLDRRAAA